jgi:putative hydrolase of the HAD superfamily
MPGALIFDLFHTLTAPPSLLDLPPHPRERLGVSRERWEEVQFSETRARLVGRVRQPADILRDITDRMLPGLEPALIGDLVLDRAHRLIAMLQQIPGETLSTLAGLRERGWVLVLLSNADAMECAPWAASPLARHFHKALFSCDIGCCKPEVESYRLAVEASGVPLESCWFIGDGGSDELVGARQAGLRTIFLSAVVEEMWPDRVPTRAGLADAHIRQLSELLLPTGPLGSR